MRRLFLINSLRAKKLFKRLGDNRLFSIDWSKYNYQENRCLTRGKPIMVLIMQSEA